MPIEIRNLSHIYNEETTLRQAALMEINCQIQDGEMLALIGETGSGKSTLVQHLNALLLPSAGEIQIDDRIIKADEKATQLKSLRKKVGLVFQFPEYQLFEETILKDIAFGPKNFGVSEEEAKKLAIQYIQVVGLDVSYLEKSPFECSGGEKRRIAIAGILAMNPDILVFDEPTAGLDPKGAKDMMELFRQLNQKYHKTIILVSHDMEHVMNYCDRVIVLNKGRILKDCSVNEFFKDTETLHQLNIDPPSILKFKDALCQKGFQIDSDALTLEKVVQCIKKEVNR